MSLLGYECEKPGLYSPLTLAFIGDGVYTMLTREYLLNKGNRPTGALHKMSISMVSATAQSEGYNRISEQLTEEETAVYKRGRNAHPGHSAKNVPIAVYNRATGMETLFGWLYLSEKKERMRELFALANDITL